MGNETTRTQSGQVYNDEVDVLELLRVLWRRKFFLIAACVLGLAASGAYLAATPKTYTATRTMILDLPNEQALLQAGARDLIRKSDGRLTQRDLIVSGREIVMDNLADYQHQHPGVANIDGVFSNRDANVLIRIQGRHLEDIGEAFAGLPEYLMTDERIGRLTELHQAGLQRKLEADADLLAQYENLLKSGLGGNKVVVIGFDVIRAMRDVQQDMAQHREMLDALDTSPLIEYIDDEFMITDVRPRTGLILALAPIGALLFAILGVLLFEAYARKTDT